MQTSIIILTYNSEKYIDPLLNSIFAFNKDEKFEVIVVDNNSSDSTVKNAKKFGSKIKIIETGDNLGFAKGINIGAKEAKGAYLLFINPDSVWFEGTIGDLTSLYEKSEKIGIVGGRMIGPSAIEMSAGKFFGFWATAALALGLDNVFKVRFSPSIVKKVEFVSGGFMMIRKNLFEELKGFDENYFMYVEDMDLCFRAKKLGFTTYFTPNVGVMHESHGSSNRSFAIKNIYKGVLFFQKMHKSAVSYFLVYLLLYLKAILLVLMGKIINNKYLVQTYSVVLKS